MNQLVADVFDSESAAGCWSALHLVVLVHNLLTNFQIETGAVRRSPTRKRTVLPVLHTIQTLRFVLSIGPRRSCVQLEPCDCDSRTTRPRGRPSPGSELRCRKPPECLSPVTLHL